MKQADEEKPGTLDIPVPFEELPQVLNPASGFIQNCNSTPYHTTTGPENPRPEDYSPTLGIETWLTNRARRARGSSGKCARMARFHSSSSRMGSRSGSRK